MPHPEPVVAGISTLDCCIRELLVLGPISHPVSAVGLQVEGLCLVDGVDLLGTLRAHKSEWSIPDAGNVLVDEGGWLGG